MAKRRMKVLPARKPARSRDDDSLLVRSAESLGRVVGSLKRRVQGTTKRMSRAEEAAGALPDLRRVGTPPGRGRKTPRARKTRAARKRAGTRKRAGARKGSRARKMAASGRKTSGR